MYLSERMWTTFEIQYLSEKEPLDYCVLILLHRQGVKRVPRLVFECVQGHENLVTNMDIVPLSDFISEGVAPYRHFLKNAPWGLSDSDENTQLPHMGF